ncbi:urea ABC transporter ATP-binding subunit UrtE [Domibacillus enclensis]|uniref:ABC transporter ATP-binding protein n=1 Tax=Domibacillus enclensis TaxID=1017273 RepID=A0A1N6ZC01_9BACI|nr:urea ABC transporter ATP-binding subunit UrtE [Domibacillus enclensis]OXS76657.1 ABC transporter ATP-binding protein [Domibacillus enclensis]SIR24301.1 urea ABC transporter ATP-binding protein /amino acid/amide ABC transporter ATP-binding protein 2, HAAT family [Domibacillus enclensis]
MLAIRSIQAGYDESMVLNDVSIQAEVGKVTAVLGRNGVGKSTLIKTIAGLLKPAAGSVEWMGERIEKKAPELRARSGIAYVPQGREIFPSLTVEENLLLGLEALPKKERKGLPPQIFEWFPVLEEMMHRKGGDLSGGQQQQLAIARAIVGKPKMLLLDEPMEGIQPSIVQLIQDVIVDIASREEMGIILVEHSLDLAFACADYYYILDHGIVVSEGVTDTAHKDVVKQHLVV